MMLITCGSRENYLDIRNNVHVISLSLSPSSFLKNIGVEPMKDLLELAEELFLRPMPGKIGEMKQRRARTNGVEGEEKALNDDYEKKRKGKEEEEKFECRLVKYEALPDYLKDNEFILDYYRSEWPLKETFLSVFLWHNETLNIWT